MSRTLRFAFVWLPLVLAVVAAPTLSRAQELTLQEAKSRGWIGEQSDGYVGLVTQEAPPAVRDLVTRINTRRTDVYVSIAKQEGISVVAVAVRSGERLIGEAAPGEWVWQNGGWRQRGS
jgi:uncharacterized protein YdbL (DUF1318 family)